MVTETSIPPGSLLLTSKDLYPYLHFVAHAHLPFPTEPQLWGTLQEHTFQEAYTYTTLPQETPLQGKQGYGSVDMFQDVGVVISFPEPWLV